ncbi:16S rRNA (guanine(527)-N(7))-methyltransferase RsmG [Halarcobacter anaerophilus]|jgi:16S rRNA (guanine527-N7)-methyltransferase|uniref:Ribosomal RNA small subunit methyltransferase G n=1 Tax=Halarcobacter anaerophilus TaxID=877500 RepID=A0A4V1LQ61_9BACT|nr:16S rRNA (guanine(527)-N(7))-methyltransferase RsmG [Halarcobacter anaerophilus]QDF28941.1 16S rRNA m7G527 methyltransferase [Halarcobacter anaerophilus]RXJ63578.1 16S rRNA (guanine(527)-N(7))-methyltransferase RsmG [Halarcobacter anaerophilus]
MALEKLLKEINVDKEFEKRCEVFISLLQKWGRVHNLSGRLSTEDIKENIEDSISPLKFIDSYESFADIGTGAGYPGLILAMANSKAKAYLIEPRQKRVSFLNFVKNSLGLENIDIIAKRVETVDNIKVDLITSRAVTNTKLLLSLTEGIKKDNTSYLFYKGSLLKEEIEEIKLNNYSVVNRNERNYLYIKGN